jgi:hypothetical protein
LLNKLQAQESPVRQSITTKSPSAAEASGGSALRIEKQRNLVKFCGLLIDVEKADLNKIQLVIWIGWNMAIINESWDGLKRGEERCAGFDWSRID